MGHSCRTTWNDLGLQKWLPTLREPGHARGEGTLWRMEMEQINGGKGTLRVDGCLWRSQTPPPAAFSQLSLNHCSGNEVCPVSTPEVLSPAPWEPGWRLSWTTLNSATNHINIVKINHGNYMAKGHGQKVEFWGPILAGGTVNLGQVGSPGGHCPVRS